LKTYPNTYPKPRFRRCEHCRKRVEAGLRCVCEMMIEQESLDAALVMTPLAPPVHAEPEEALFRREWPALAIVATLMVLLVIGVQMLRLQTWGEAEVRSWSPPESVEVRR